MSRIPMTDDSPHAIERQGTHPGAHCPHTIDVHNRPRTLDAQRPSPLHVGGRMEETELDCSPAHHRCPRDRTCAEPLFSAIHAEVMRAVD